MKTNLNIVYPLLTFVIWYSLGIKCIIHFGIPTFCWAHYQLFFFCRSIKAKSRFRFFLMFASWIWLSRKIASVVPRPAMNLNCICNALRGLVPFVQFKKREKHPWRSVTFRLKVTLIHGCFSRFLNCTNGTKSRIASHFSFTFNTCIVKFYLS